MIKFILLFFTCICIIEKYKFSQADEYIPEASIVRPVLIVYYS
jgi:hypothetical protein